MTLYLETPDGFVVWAGQPIGEGEDAVCHPLNIEQLWSAGALADWGLYAPAEADPVPEGKVSTGRGVKRVDGVVKFVHTLVSAPSPTVDDIVAERARRLSLGFDYDFGDERGVHHIGTTAQDQEGWTEVTQIALVRVAKGDNAFISIVTGTGPVDVEPSEWLEVLEAATAFRQPIWGASFVLQAIDPIPQDFTSDSYWAAL